MTKLRRGAATGNRRSITEMSRSCSNSRRQSAQPEIALSSLSLARERNRPSRNSLRVSGETCLCPHRNIPMPLILMTELSGQ